MNYNIRIKYTSANCWCSFEKEDGIYYLMKRLVFIFVILFCLTFLASAQEDSLKRSTIYKTWITLGGGSEIKGTIYQLRDSSILIANTYRKADLLTPGKLDLKTIDINNIYLITCRNKDNVWPGAVIGMVTGIISGVIIGQLTWKKGDDPMEDYRPLASVVFGTLFAIPGAVAGIIVTDIAFTFRIPISGNFENYNKNKSRLKKYSYLH